jgi:nitrogen fixation/metabolism regulation signal transduction histidine kinase
VLQAKIARTFGRPRNWRASIGRAINFDGDLHELLSSEITFKKAPPKMDRFDANEAIRNAIILTRG